jgi:hypothetical protein
LSKNSLIWIFLHCKNNGYNYFWITFGFFFFIGLISNFQDMHVNMLKIKLYKNNFICKKTNFKNVRYTNLSNGFNFLGTCLQNYIHIHIIFIQILYQKLIFGTSLLNFFYFRKRNSIVSNLNFLEFQQFEEQIFQIHLVLCICNNNPMVLNFQQFQQLSIFLFLFLN